MLEFFDQVVFNIGARAVTGAQLVWMVFFLISWIIVFRLFSTNNIKKLYDSYGISQMQQRKLKWILGLLLALTSLILISWLFSVNMEILSIKDKKVTIQHLIKAFCVLQAARLLDWTLSNIFIHRYYYNREKLKSRRLEKKLKTEDKEEQEKGASKIVQYIVYLIALIFILRSFDLDYTFFTRTIGEQSVDFNLSKVFSAALILLVARLAVSLITQILLHGVYLNREIDEGSQFAINQLLKYVIYVIAIIFTLETLGINMTLILGGAAALLVGIGLGLQQTFNDFISGIVLLFERSISVGDVVSVGDQFGKVQRIGLRSSVVETRDNMTIVVPNSKLVNDVVNNWSHFNPTVRFSLEVGVAYGSDTALIKKLLLQAANGVGRVLFHPKPFIRFQNFGDSSLLFTVLFFTNENLYHEDIKSDIRFEIDRLFRENNILIPFPQRDIWIKDDKT